MANPVIDPRDVRFILFEMFNIESLTKYENFNGFTKQIFDDILTLAEKTATENVYPINAAADKQGCVYDAATHSVHVPPEYIPAMRAFYKAGFMGLSVAPEYGGCGLPAVLNYAAIDFFTCASAAFTMYPLLAEGAFNMYTKFLPDSKRKEAIIKNMLAGNWCGSMCLTESDAGSDVGALRTKATRNPDGSYSITGQKIFITAGDNDIFENSVHPVLARVEGDPAGTGGISIFAVPKFRINEDGSLGERNDVVCSGVEHKMGLTASATCVLNFGDSGACQGFILGEERQGMKIMFQMMNETRLHVANQGMSLSSAAYMHAAAYAKNRIQGRDAIDAENKNNVPIIKHPDIKRLLLSMKSKVEAMRSLAYYCGLLMDLQHNGDGTEAKDAGELLEFLIPINKAGNAGTSWDVTADAIQVYGGYGYCKDNIVEQYARDSKILSIYEGTNGIQSMDLMLRKLLLDKEQHKYAVYRQRIDETVSAAKTAGVEEKYTAALAEAAQTMDGVVAYLKQKAAERSMEDIYLNAVPLQQAFTVLTYAWMQLWGLASAAPKLTACKEDTAEFNFYKGRMLSGKFYIGTELPIFIGRCKAVTSGENAAAFVEPQVLSSVPER